jgi:hypothetical protein
MGRKLEGSCTLLDGGRWMKKRKGRKEQWSNIAWEGPGQAEIIKVT